MERSTLVFEETFEVYTCCHPACGIRFAMSAAYVRDRRKDHQWWHCPNGHLQHFDQESKEERLQRELQVAQQQMARIEDERREAERREAAAKREVARVVKRAHAGVCPCCQRSFANVARHMKMKHPNITPLAETGRAAANR
jgi:hypothetical protein